MAAKRNKWIEEAIGQIVTERRLALGILNPSPELFKEILRICSKHQGHKLVILDGNSKAVRAMQQNGHEEAAA